MTRIRISTVFGLVLIFTAKNSDGAMNMGTYIFMNVVRQDSSEKSIEICANFYPNSKRPGAIPVARNIKDAIPYHLMDDDFDSLCHHMSRNSSLSGDIIRTYLYWNEWPEMFNVRCETKSKNINDRILDLEARNASAVLFVTTPDETHASYYDPRVNSSVVTLPIYYINNQTQNKLQKFISESRGSNYVMRFFIPADPVVDAAMVIILCIAMICICIGGAWSGRKHYELFVYDLNRKLTPSIGSSRHSQRTSRPEENGADTTPPAAKSSRSDSFTTEPPAAPFNWITLVLFLIIIVGFLLLLYYLYKAMVWLVIIIYVVASSCAMCECLWYFVEKIPYGKCSFRLDPLADFLKRICRCCDWKTFRVTIEYRHAALYAFCASVSIIWCVFRHWSYSFVLHDILAMFFSIVTIRNLRIPNLMWITSLLSLLLVYDLFMVFITPYFTPSGCSIMVDVATGGACSKSVDVPDATHNYPPSSAPPKEELPIVIRVPRFNDPLWSCYRMDVDLQYPPVILGLGDIILPGILIGYNAAFSLAAGVPYRVYYIVGVVGYFFGMIATFVALIVSRLAQPALIYLVPFTLLPTHIAALWRKEWKKMWKGQFPLVEESCPILKQDGSAESHPRQSTAVTTGSTAARASITGPLPLTPA